MDPILIIGAGLTGLALAQALKKRNIPFKVFERDASLDSRAQGYRIRLNRLGLEALHELVPSEVWDQIIREAADWYPGIARLDAFSGEAAGPVIGTPDRPGGAPPPPHLHPPVALDDPFVRRCTSTRIPVDRKRYRDALAHSIDITYGKSLSSYESTPEGVVAHFDDGSSSPRGSLIVGCDGFHSRVAQLLEKSPPAKKIGGGMIYGKAPLTAELEEALCPAAKYGIRVCTESGHPSPGINNNLFIEVCRFSDANSPGNYVFFVLSATDEFRDLAGPHADLASWAPDELADLAIRFVKDKGYHPGLQAILQHQNPNVATYHPYSLTVPDAYPSWKTNPRVTILGDAVHAVPPVGGIGGNAGLRDVQTLVEIIANNTAKGDWGESISSWEGKAREEGWMQIKLVYAATMGSFPLVFWKSIYWDGAELGLPPPLSPP